MTDISEADRAFVWWIARRDPRSVVRVAALTAVASANGDTAIERFLTSEYDYAKELAERRSARNADFARRVLETHTAEFAPEVHAAARRAMDGTSADRAWFAETGYAEAEARDRAARERSGEQQEALAEADRAYVRNLAAADPGPQVRAAAQWAVRPAATDSDLVEFFAYDWASAARLDLEAHRLRMADNEVAWRATVNRLVTEARAAEQAASEAAGEAEEQARAAAARAWRTVADNTDSPRTAWAEAGEVAREQAANWHAVAEAARQATGPNWAAVVDFSAENEHQWTAERDTIAEQARFWNGLLEQALAGEQRMLNEN
ncbi:hypothetical protein [Amycolatopsis aidingensis]|uniref:hypothetical protein n=1 Tax=Amycolatopsis aidingensis TaxID=2842453 RepID=UPI001E33032B|nr:hypothetical protein [Amycolatopsis aidingensis]